MIKLVMLVLVMMSILSWNLILFKSRQLNLTLKDTKKNISILKVQSSLQTALKRLKKTPDSPSFIVASEGINEISRLMNTNLPDDTRDRIILNNIRQTLQEEINIQVEELYGTLPFLGTCTTVAPLLGLFGTVWGIMNSFHGFRGLTTSSLNAIAPGMAEALVTTVIGLIVAIPAAMANNILIRMLESIEINLVKFSSTFLRLLEKELAGKTLTKPHIQPDQDA